MPDLSAWDIQMLGVGLAAFLDAILFGVFLFSGVRSRVTRCLVIVLISSFVWAFSGFLYHLTTNDELARLTRVISQLAAIWTYFGSLNFAVEYLTEKGAVTKTLTRLRSISMLFGLAFSLMLVADAFGARLVVGDLLAHPTVALSPQAGPMMAYLIVYDCSMVLIAMVLLLRYTFTTAKGRDAMLESTVLAIGIPGALLLGALRFAPWYGADILPLLGGLAMPVFAATMFYVIARFNAFSMQVITAQILVYCIWTFVFIRLLFAPTFTDAVPDLILFIALLAVGGLLIRSVTREIQAQHELARLTVESAKSEFVTIAAHQLRTPLSVVRWVMSILIDPKSGPLTNEQRDLIDKSTKASNTIAGIVEDLLSAARITGGGLSYNMQSCDVRECVRGAVSSFDAAAKGRDISLLIDLPLAPIPVLCDSVKLTMAIENLIDNAIKYSLPGGSVHVSIESDKESISIRIADTGIGFKPEEKARIFEKFFRGKQAMKMFTDGSGLGLYIVRSIVEAHQGTVSFASAEGGGTIVTLRIPAT